VKLAVAVALSTSTGVSLSHWSLTGPKRHGGDPVTVAENVVAGAPWSPERLTAGAIIWVSPGELPVVTAGDLLVAGAVGIITTGDLFGTGGGVVVNEGSGVGGGSPQAGAAATHNVANATAVAITSATTAALRERRRDRAHLMPSPLTVSTLAILVRSEHSDASSPLLKFVTFFQIANDFGRYGQRQRN
jgi:hypothetical protein